MKINSEYENEKISTIFTNEVRVDGEFRRKINQETGELKKDANNKIIWMHS